MSTKLSLLEVDLDVPLRRIRDHQYASLTRFSELSRNLKFYHFIWWEITSLSIQINMKVQTEAERLWQNHDEHQAWTVFTSWIYFPTKLQFVYSWSIFDSRSSPHEDFSPVALCIHISIYIYIYIYTVLLSMTSSQTLVYIKQSTPRLIAKDWIFIFRLLFYNILLHLTGHTTRVGVWKLSARLWSENLNWNKRRRS